MSPPAPAKSAFSLVELSIVLVILGLLTGGILAGQSLIRAAELRAVTTEYSRYSSSYYAFRDKYFALPGDMTNATSFWGVTAACPGTAGTGTQTCNGDGDGIVEYNNAASQYNEIFTFWQHLANAGLIEGTYTGIAGSSANIQATAANVPRSKLNNARWYAFNWNTTFSGNTGAYDGTYTDNMLQFGALTSGGSPAIAVLKPEESWNIDKKIDDGRPAYGIMRERLWDDCTDATSSADLDSDYLLTLNSAVCLPLFTLK